MKKLLLLFAMLFAFNANAYGECSQYGYAAYNDNGYCKCLIGYKMSNNFLGKPYCVSGTTYCFDEFGYNSQYNILSNSCECRSGYIATVGILGNQTCSSGDSVCREKYGLYSSYNSTAKQCKCDDGYTFDDNDRCVKKQNNVYFILKDLDTDKREAVITSTYDSRSYKVSYGVGCLSSTIGRYMNKNLVVNLGTDYSLDAWDTIVLQNDSQTCNIVSKTYVASNYSLEDEKGVVMSATNVTAGMKEFIPEGALIRTKDNPDIYIVKYVGSKWFKRLVLSPSVFKTYGHLKWENVLIEDQSVLNTYITSSLVQAVGDDKIYMLYPQGDTGEKRQIKDNSVFSKMGIDQESIYVINSFDRDSYITGKILE